MITNQETFEQKVEWLCKKAKNGINPWSVLSGNEEIDGCNKINQIKSEILNREKRVKEAIRNNFTCECGFCIECMNRYNFEKELELGGEDEKTKVSNA